jgi:hypothetical protein
MEKVRSIFIYLTMMALILGAIGIFILSGNPSPKVIGENREERYSIAEVITHNTEKDCWISMGGEVYDITLFLQIYNEDLRDKCGSNVDKNLFPINVRKVLDGYKIGVLK